ncbi:hypothetical protein BS78_04G256100 [Paspalum vaginatum]|nr:hypothetical protein BS78_04G256100 [Paspalum vaginatum]
MSECLEITVRPCPDHMLPTPTFRNITRSVVGHLGMQVCSLSGVLFVCMNLSGACKLQKQEMACWNVDARVRYFLVFGDRRLWYG